MTISLACSRLCTHNNHKIVVCVSPAVRTTHQHLTHILPSFHRWSNTSLHHGRDFIKPFQVTAYHKDNYPRQSGTARPMRPGRNSRDNPGISGPFGQENFFGPANFCSRAGPGRKIDGPGRAVTLRAGPAAGFGPSCHSDPY